MTGFPVIKFSYEYLKLVNAGKPSSAMLLAVFREPLSQQLSQEFVDYDTAYYGPAGNGVLSFYSLPKGTVLILLFHGSFKGTGLFTTVRRWTPQKEVYYRSQVGKCFEVVVDGKQ